MSFKGLSIGVSGLEGQSTKMEVIGNNLANLSTTGFKKANVNFQETFHDVLSSASAPTGVMGGTNPMTVGSGSQVSSITNIFTQGNQISTNRTLDFMIEGDDFFVVQNGGNEHLMLTRDGSFQLDGDGTLVDSVGNKVMGFNVDSETGTVDASAGEVTIDYAAIAPKPTSEIRMEANIDSSSTQMLANDDVAAWELFSGGENFGGMTISIPGGTGSRDNYGSGFYQDSIDYTDTAAAINVGLTDVTLQATPANLVDGFAVGDTVSLLQGTNQVQRTITAVNSGTRTITLSAAAPGTFNSGATLQITNLSDGKSAQGSSGTARVHSDVLKSQISMVDDDGNLIASFYRVGADPAKYSRATATVTGGGGTITTGVGEFTNMTELKELFELALRDSQLSNYAASTDLDISIDKFGKVEFGGTGLVQEFRLVMNADNTEMLDRFSGIAMTDDGAVATTQARVDSSGEIIAPASLAMGTRATHASKWWFNTSGLENYGFSATDPSTEYGEYAGLRLDSGANGTGYGIVQLSLTNALGETKTKEFRAVANDPDPTQAEFTTMGELALMLQNTLRSDEFSGVATNGTLTADQTASVSFNNGRLSVNTVSGQFRNLTISAMNTAADNANGVTRSDSMNFGTVLGELASGVNGKSGSSNLFIQADARSQVSVHDSQGNEHTATTYFVRDRSSGLTNIEWKFRAGLNPNVNSFASQEGADNDVYGNTYNSLEDAGTASGVLAFDIDSGQVMGEGTNGSDSRYVSEGNLKFLPAGNSQEADQSDITIDFTSLTSYNGRNTVIGHNVDGYAMGNLVRLTTEANTGNINGVYSNGKIRTLAKIGLMSIANAEGLEKIGSSYYMQTPNSSEGGNTKGIDQVFFVGETGNASGDSVTSRIHGMALEASNVDITEELTDMIKTQRSYSASGKIITTSDDMLQEALNLKREILLRSSV